MIIPGRMRERLLSKISFEPNTGCWIWHGSHGQKGYGEIRVNYKLKRAHRVVYEEFIGKIPDDMVIDHLCLNKWCVNPDHLQVVTPGENTRRANIQREPPSKCPAGHDYDYENTYTYKDGTKHCRKCHAASQLRYVNNMNRNKS